MRTKQKIIIIWTSLLSAVFLASTINPTNTGPTKQHEFPLYFELGPCAEANYCHVVQYNLFPIFVALAQMDRHRAFAHNKFYCDRLPFKPEVFRLLSDYPIEVTPAYDPLNMQKLSFGIPGEAKEIFAHYFPLFLAQARERFNVTYQPNNNHKTTLTLIQRNCRCRNIINLPVVQRALSRYCDRNNFALNIVMLEKASFQEQLRLMADTDIFIACHGAAMTNAVFIRKNGIVIELFPYNFSYSFFRLFVTNCRPDITYYRWTLDQRDCSPTTEKSKIKEHEFRYWRDHNIRIAPDRLIEIIEQVRNSRHRNITADRDTF